MTRVAIVTFDDSTTRTRPLAVPVPTYLEFDLSFVIERCGVTNGDPVRRLNGIENTAAALARRWRDDVPLAPARELRMSDETRQALLA